MLKQPYSDRDPQGAGKEVFVYEPMKSALVRGSDRLDATIL